MFCCQPSSQVGERTTDTSGEFALFEVPAAPNAGPPLRMDYIENEGFYILDGKPLSLGRRVGADNSVPVDYFLRHA